MDDFTIKEQLQGLGLSDKEAKVYMASLELLTINNWVNKIKIVYLRQMRRHGGEKIRNTYNLIKID